MSDAERKALRDRLRAAILAKSWSDWDAGEGTVIEMGLDDLVATILETVSSRPEGCRS